MSGKKELAGHTVVVIGGTSGIGLETARLARAEGAEVVVTARDANRLQDVGRELGARTAAFDATDFQRLGKFSTSCPRRLTTCWSRAPVLTTRRWRSSRSTSRAATSKPISSCR